MMGLTNKFNFRTQLLLIALAMMTWSGQVSAQNAPSHIPTAADVQKMREHNLDQINKLGFQGLATQRTHQILPYAEYNEPGYLIMSSEEDFSSGHVKKSLLENLPEDMIAIIYTDASMPSQIERVYQKFSKFTKNPEQVRIVNIRGSYRGFWARDAVPVPVWKKELAVPIEGFDFGVVDARYYHRFEPDQFFASAFQASMTKYDYYFEGGNFVPNSKGDCLIVNKIATQDIPDAIFLNHYGCTKLVRLDHLVGIGHADEVVKFVADDHVLTDQPSYKSLLESNGFKVTMLPRAAGEYETYVNSLIIKNKVFVPIFNRGSDAEAIRTYESLGFEVVALNTSTLSNQGAGSIHCITMTYPKDVTYDRVIDIVAGKDVTPVPGSDIDTTDEATVLEETYELDSLDTDSDGDSWWDWLFAQADKYGSVSLASSKSAMPPVYQNDEDAHLETYERDTNDDYVGGFMESEGDDYEIL